MNGEWTLPLWVSDKLQACRQQAINDRVTACHSIVSCHILARLSSFLYWERCQNQNFKILLPNKFLLGQYSNFIQGTKVAMSWVPVRSQKCWTRSAGPAKPAHALTAHFCREEDSDEDAAGASLLSLIMFLVLLLMLLLFLFLLLLLLFYIIIKCLFKKLLLFYLNT